jgi:hypothetical protein
MTRKTKLTLSIDEDVIRHAKRFTRRHGTSISKLVSQFLASLGEEGQRGAGSVVSRLRGVLSSDASVEDYHRHLDEKYGR